MMAIKTPKSHRINRTIEEPWWRVCPEENARIRAHEKEPVRLFDSRGNEVALRRRIGFVRKPKEK